MSRTLVVVINGAGGVGKDTLVNMLVSELYIEGDLVASNHSSVDIVKKAARLLGWDGVKDDKGRQFLSDLKDLSTKFYDGPVRYMNDLILERANDVMFFHIREPQEIARFLEMHEGSISILVKRDGLETWGNHADQNVANHPYTFVVENNGSLEDLQVKAKRVALYLAVAWERLQPKKEANDA